MSNEIGAVINATEPGEPDSGANDANTGGGASGTSAGEIINGRPEDDEPATARIERPVRTTRTGAIDGRSLRRGRRSNTSTGNAPAAAPSSICLSTFSFGELLVGIHAMLAGMTKVEELQIDASEGKKLGDAVNTVLQQYNHVINPKMAAWVNLGMVSAAVYGPRYMAVKLRHETEKQKPRVVEMPAPFPEPPVPQDRDGSIM